MSMLAVAQREGATCSAANIGHDSLPTPGWLTVAVSKPETVHAFAGETGKLRQPPGDNVRCLQPLTSGTLASAFHSIRRWPKADTRRTRRLGKSIGGRGGLLSGPDVDSDWEHFPQQLPRLSSVRSWQGTCDRAAASSRLLRPSSRKTQL